MVSSAEKWAEELHASDTYGDKSYKDGHLREVVLKLIELGYGFDGALIDAGWLHDSVEDVHEALDDKLALLGEVRRRHGERTADLVWAVTGMGKSRKARNANAYAKIVLVQDAPVLKYADRFINVTNSKPGSSHWKMYRKEHDGFYATMGPFLPEAWEGMMLAAFGG